MKTIYKFQLSITDRQVIEMSANAEILTVQTQNNSVCLWALVDTLAPKQLRGFEVFGTGYEVPITEEDESRLYLGTCQLNGGQLVFHVFEFFGDLTATSGR